MKQGLTQPMLAAKCNLLGWDLSRESLAKIEAQIRWVADFEMVCLAKSLGVQIEALLPQGFTAAAKGSSLLRRFLQKPS